MVNGLSCSMACGIFPDQGLNPCSLHWQVDSKPLHHQGSPGGGSLTYEFSVLMNRRKVIDIQFVQLFLIVRMGLPSFYMLS